MGRKRHPDLIEYYRIYNWEKTSYANFANRHLRLWYSKEEAILPKVRRAWAPDKTKVEENGRECTVCWEMQNRDQFAKSKLGINGKTSDCKDCRNKRVRWYREKNWERYKSNYKDMRKLHIGEYIALLEPVYVDWFPREDVYEVLDYEFRQWYKLRSTLTGYYRNACTWSNPNSIKYYRVEKPDFIIYEWENANSEEKERAKERAWME